MTEVDLRPLADDIRPAIAAGVSSLLDELGDEPDLVSAMGIYFGLQGPFCVIQAENGAGLGRGDGADSAGRFTNNLPDWHWYLDEVEFEGYGDFPFQNDLVVVGSDGPVTPDGGAALFAVVAAILRPTVSEFLPFSELPRAQPFRVGIQPIGGRGEFWLLRDRADPTAANPFDRWVVEVTR